ncbi:hypothetical protein CEP51_002806 [Fusarium floridanum]|uniref:Uncharacterized protein n=1 Tax=Fusarium floridanum TaxID=1325733 RepID=A0A428S9J5_9HYPO|nr:hypothetical protein CEP51_002806 [Fusarium floridanum]
MFPSAATDEATGTVKRARAKHACRVNCEVLPSRRGRYPRKNKRQKQLDQQRPSDLSPSVQGSDGGLLSHRPTSSVHTVASGATPNTERDAADTRISARSPSPSTDSAAPGTLFFGESNFLTLVPGMPRVGEQHDEHDDQNGSKQKARLLFPINSTPQSIPEGASPASIDHRELALLTNFTLKKQRLTFQDRGSRLEIPKKLVSGGGSGGLSTSESDKQLRLWDFPAESEMMTATLNR